MTLEEQFSEALQEVLRDNPGISQAEAEQMASELVTPAGEPDRYVAEEMASKGGFIGDPSKPGSNRFSTADQPNGISSYSPAPVVPPWMAVQPAGMANELPGYADYSRDIQAGFSEPQATERSLDPINQREKYMDSVIATAGEVPKEVLGDLESGWNAAIPRYKNLIDQNVPAKEADSIALAPIRDKTIRTAAEYRYKIPADRDYSVSLVVDEDILGKQRTSRFPLSQIIKNWDSLPEKVRNNPVNRTILEAFGVNPDAESMPDIRAAGGGAKSSNSSLKVGRFTVIPQ